MTTDPGAVFDEMAKTSAPLSRVADRDSFYIHLPGGLQAGKVTEDGWCLEPLWLNGQARRGGTVRKNELVRYVTALGLWPVGFHNFGWFKGEHSSHWVPMTSKSDSHVNDPAQLWGNISYQVSHLRREPRFASAQTLDEIAALADERNETDRLAHSITLSIRSMGTSVLAISEYYNERLVDGLFRGDWRGHRFATTADQNLYAQVHSFFLHWGSARDYLSALIALRVGLNPSSPAYNSLPRLLRHVSLSDARGEPLLRLLVENGNVEKGKSKGLEMSGWLAEASSLRDELVHRRPYGQQFLETRGSIEAVRADHGVFRYFRPIVRRSGTQDVFDAIIYHYRQTMILFQEAAIRSGYSSQIPTFTDDDVVSLQEHPLDP